MGSVFRTQRWLAVKLSPRLMSFVVAVVVSTALFAPAAPGQSAEDGELVLEPPAIVEPSGIELDHLQATLDESALLDSETATEVVVIESEEAKPPTRHVSPKKSKVEFGDWLGYNSAKSETTWLASDELGLFSIESFPTIKLGEESGLVFGTGYHFLNGPAAPEMPPRLFDFQFAFHTRKQFNESFFLDTKFGVGAFSDFEGSARDGVRYPGHFVSYWQRSSRCVLVGGIEVLDRDDVSVLPVAGMVWQPHEDVLLELIFPRPRMQLKLDSDCAIYLGGELGGGTWAIERTEGGVRNDNATYRDLRLLFGVTNDEDLSSALEFGFAFDRSIEYRSGVGDRALGSAFILRAQTRF